MGREAKTFRNGNGVYSYSPTPNLSLSNRLSMFAPARQGEMIPCKADRGDSHHRETLHHVHYSSTAFRLCNRTHLRPWAQVAR